MNRFTTDKKVNSRMEQQLEFSLEIDKVKNVFRKNHL